MHNSFCVKNRFIPYYTIATRFNSAQSRVLYSGNFHSNRKFYEFFTGATK